MILSSLKIGKKENDNSHYNGGYSLVELIVVIGIMSVMIGLLSLGVSVMFSRDAQSAAMIIDDAMSEARMYSMSKAGTTELLIHTTATASKDNTVTITTTKADGTSESKQYTIDKNVLISAVQTNGSGSWTGGSGSDISIIFDKSNGSVKSVDGTADGVYVFTVTSSSKTAIVNLIAVTGRHYVNK